MMDTRLSKQVGYVLVAVAASNMKTMAVAVVDSIVEVP